MVANFAQSRPRGSRGALLPPHHEGLRGAAHSVVLVLRRLAQQGLEGRGRLSLSSIKNSYPRTQNCPHNPRTSPANGGLQRTVAGVGPGTGQSLVAVVLREHHAIARWVKESPYGKAPASRDGLRLSFLSFRDGHRLGIPLYYLQPRRRWAGRRINTPSRPRDAALGLIAFGVHHAKQKRD